MDSISFELFQIVPHMTYFHCHSVASIEMSLSIRSSDRRCGSPSAY